MPATVAYTLALGLLSASSYLNGYSSAIQYSQYDKVYNLFLSASSGLGQAASLIPHLGSEQFTVSAEHGVDSLSAMIVQFLDMLQNDNSLVNGAFLPGGAVLSGTKDLYDAYYARISLNCEYLPAFSSDVSAVSSAFSLYASKFADSDEPFVSVTTCGASSSSASAASSAVSNPSAADTCEATLSSVVLDGTVHACRVAPACSSVASITDYQPASSTAFSVTPATTVGPTGSSPLTVTTLTP